MDDGAPGRSITFTTWENIRPLGYAELAQARLHEKLTIPLELRGSKIVDTSVDDLDTTSRRLKKLFCKAVGV